MSLNDEVAEYLIRTQFNDSYPIDSFGGETNPKPEPKYRGCCLSMLILGLLCNPIESFWSLVGLIEASEAENVEMDEVTEYTQLFELDEEEAAGSSADCPMLLSDGEIEEIFSLIPDTEQMDALEQGKPLACNRVVESGFSLASSVLRS